MHWRNLLIDRHKFDLTPLIDPSQLSYTQKCFENRMTIDNYIFLTLDFYTRNIVRISNYKISCYKTDSTGA